MISACPSSFHFMPSCGLPVFLSICRVIAAIAGVTTAAATMMGLCRILFGRCLNQVARWHQAHHTHDAKKCYPLLFLCILPYQPRTPKLEGLRVVKQLSSEFSFSARRLWGDRGYQSPSHSWSDVCRLSAGSPRAYPSIIFYPILIYASLVGLGSRIIPYLSQGGSLALNLRDPKP